METGYGYIITAMEENGNACVRAYENEEHAGVLYIDSLSVNEAFRKQGMGAQLMDWCEFIAKSMNMTKLMLWTDDNSWQAEWYKRRGFKFLTEKSDIEGKNPQIWLVKKL